MSSIENLTMLAELKEKHTPFQMLIATILSARAKDEVTLPVSKELFKKYGTPKTLANADSRIVKNIIKKIGFYNTKTKAIIATANKIQDDFHGHVPETLDQLMSLPGVGRKVANCVLVYAFGKNAIPVDTHVHRISNRLGWAKTKTPDQTERRLEAIIPRKYWPLVNETLVKYGKTICAPISPFCSKCTVAVSCPRIGVIKSR
ncbi:endonuclease III [PVC group bacterium]|nr:endonuclease III [PVC group bacterium]